MTTRRRTHKGFTLIETMVAITILVVAVAAPLTLAAQSLFAALYAKDQTTAFYLAQEAVETIRNKRDGNMLQFLNGQNTGWLDTIPVGTSFWVDVPNDTLTTCGSTCLDSKLLHNGTFYNYQTGDTTRFGRSVLVTQNPNLTDEATIAVTVEWQTGSFKERRFTLQERIYNWVPNQN
jgi:prepilin-type N-terminal cleavage/methylation domain-containing protein